MSMFSVTVGVGNPAGGDLIEVSAVVDTGAHHTMLPRSLMTQLHIPALVERLFEFADGYVETLSVGQGRIAYNGEEWVCPVIFGGEGKYLLGVSALEAFDLAVDPSNRILIPIIHPERPYLTGR